MHWLMEQWEETQHLSLRFTILVGFMVAKINYSSNINVIHHCNKYNDNEKGWNIMRITKRWHSDLKCTNAVGKIGADKEFLYARLPQTSICFLKRKLSVKCNSMSFVCNILQKSRNSDSVIFKLIFLGTQLFWNMLKRKYIVKYIWEILGLKIKCYTDCVFFFIFFNEWKDFSKSLAF